MNTANLDFWQSLMLTLLIISDELPAAAQQRIRAKFELFAEKLDREKADFITANFAHAAAGHVWEPYKKPQLRLVK